jgi:hypothetical protein
MKNFDIMCIHIDKLTIHYDELYSNYSHYISCRYYHRRNKSSMLGRILSEMNQMKCLKHIEPVTATLMNIPNVQNPRVKFNYKKRDNHKSFNRSVYRGKCCKRIFSRRS